MKKILIISFYELKDYLLYIKELFEQYLFTVIEYPLFKYAYDKNDKIDNYKENLNQYIKKNSPDIILWWFIDVPVDVFKYVKDNNKNLLYIMYNSDDPLNITKELFDKCKIFDIIISPCKETIHLYKLYAGVSNVIFGPMGFDKNLFKYIDKNDISETDYKEYECDVSMLTYNLYLDKSYYPNQTVYKKDLLDNVVNLCERKGYKLKLYGTPFLKEYYPKYYHGEIPYYKLNLLYNFSKINLITSSHNNKDSLVNEYLSSMLACGSLIMHDKTKNIQNILKNGENAIIFDENNYLSLMEQILDNYDSYDHIKTNAIIHSNKFSWESWVFNIISTIGEHFFDKETYANLYNLDQSDNLLEHWKTTGIKEKKICFDFKVPDSFNFEEYAGKCGLKKDKKISFLHWYCNSKDDIYFKRTSSNEMNFVPSNYNIIADDYYTICNIFNQITNCKFQKQGLLQLGAYCKTIPYVKINDILDKYIEMTF